MHIRFAGTFDRLTIGCLRVNIVGVLLLQAQFEVGIVDGSQRLSGFYLIAGCHHDRLDDSGMQEHDGCIGSRHHLPGGNHVAFD